MGAVLIKGGHWGGADEAIDVLVTADGHEVARSGPRIRTDGPVHGTGCALSTAIAVQPRAGLAAREACRAAKRFVAS